MSARQRLTFAGLAVLIAVVAVVVLVVAGGSSDDSSSVTSVKATPTPTQTAAGTGGAAAATATAQAAGPRAVQIVVRNGEPVGGIHKIKVNKGDRIAFRVTSDTADEVHVHGFDFHKDVAKGGSVSFSFPATITGVFEVELEAAKVQLASLTIEP